MLRAPTFQVRAARDDLAAFASLVGWPLTDWQAASLRLERRITCLVSARQLGKSRSLALVALHRAYRQPEHHVLVVSASEDAARRLLASVRAIAAHPLLAESVIDENAGLVVLSSGSTIRSVAASERAIRGWSVDTLIVDEASLIGDDVLEGAALPTTAARPHARIVMASTPWGAGGGFRRLSDAGLAGDGPDVATHRWHVEQAPWIGPARVAELRLALSPARFAAEVEGRWTDAADLYFDREQVLVAVAPYRLLDPADARGEPVAGGLDWGRAQDAHAIALLGVLEDYGANDEPQLYVPWIEVSRRPYAAQVQAVLDLDRSTRSLPAPPDLYAGFPAHKRPAGAPPPGPPGYRLRRVLSEANGVGASVSEELEARLPGRVVAIHTSQTSKEDAYGRLRTLLSGRALVLPAHERLLAQLLAVGCAPTPSGGLSIGAAGPGADDLADALSLAAQAAGTVQVPGTPADPSEADAPFVFTGDGRAVPAAPRPRLGALGPRPARILTP